MQGLPRLGGKSCVRGVYRTACGPPPIACPVDGPETDFVPGLHPNVDLWNHVMARQRRQRPQAPRIIVSEESFSRERCCARKRSGSRKANRWIVLGTGISAGFVVLAILFVTRSPAGSSPDPLHAAEAQPEETEDQRNPSRSVKPARLRGRRRASVRPMKPPSNVELTKNNRNRRRTHRTKVTRRSWNLWKKESSSAQRTARARQR